MKSETLRLPTNDPRTCCDSCHRPGRQQALRPSGEAGRKIDFSVTRFDPMDRPAPEFMVKNGWHGNCGESALDLYRRAVHRHFEGRPIPRFLRTRCREPVLSTVVPPELQKDLLLVFIPVKESFEILKIHAPPSAIQGGDHYVINATTTDVAIKFGTLKPVLIHIEKISAFA